MGKQKGMGGHHSHGKAQRVWLTPPAIIIAPRTTHSTKPENLQDQIDAAWPDLPKLEMFSRRTRPGWDHMGNEVE